MATEVKLPQLGQTMEEGTIVSCVVNVGDKVNKGDVLFEIEADKATLKMESPAEGFVKHIVAQPGQTLLIDELMLILGDETEQVPAPDKKAEATAAAPTPKAESPAPSLATVETPTGANVVRLPQLGQTMEEGTIVNCLVKVDDKVSRGDVLFEIETDKATLEIESPGGGFVKAILVEAGQTIPVHEPILVLGEEDTQVTEAFISTLKAGDTPPATQPVTEAPAKPAEAVAQVGGGCDTYTKADGEYKLGQVIPLNRLQKITGERMLKSKREMPCFYLTVRVDMTELVEHREKINSDGLVKVSYNDFIIRAVAIGLEKFPIMTGQLEGETIKLADSIDVGLAISVPGGLVAPLVKNADKKDVQQVARDTQGLIQRASENRLSLEDLEGGCITVSNLGAFGVESFIPIVVPGQCSILGISQIIDTPVPQLHDMSIRKLMNMTLSADHKVANGAYAGQFLDYIRKLLEDASNFQ